ncbi:hypothetical protein ACEV93_25375, partial [Vibrio parahaemolyticus]
MLGLKEWKPLNPENLNEDLNSESTVALRRKLYEQAITIAANDDKVFPIHDPAARRTASVSIDIKGFSAFQKNIYQYAEMD